MKERLIDINNMLREININVSKRIEKADFSIIKKFYDNDSDCKIVIVNNSDSIELILASENNVKFVFENKDYFEKIVLPEVLKMYSLEVESLELEEKIRDFNKMFYKVNEQLYMLNFYDEVVEYNIRFLHSLVMKKKYKLELNKDIVIDNVVDNDIKITKKSYSYGYVNILLISFIISLLTIMVCLFRI